ncbi:MAG: hypothetical protein KBE16_03210 [Alphaproteobacteria bacterium]|jgi:hypothetical protein|nr:hypothetical protein [Alphaproteobacteria bacterium]MBP9877046.1 hypothetical protein [Alphaproteobacteria bacterium]
MIIQKNKLSLIALFATALFMSAPAAGTILAPEAMEPQEELQPIQNNPTLIDQDLAEAMVRPVDTNDQAPELSQNALMHQEMIDMQPEDEILGQNAQEMNNQMANMPEEEGDYQATAAEEPRPGFLNFLNIPNLLIVLLVLGSAIYMIRRFTSRRDKVACVSLIRNNNINRS